MGEKGTLMSTKSKEWGGGKKKKKKKEREREREREGGTETNENGGTGGQTDLHRARE